MTEKTFLIDVDKCVGCYACEIACKQENSLASRPIRVVTLGPRKVGRKKELHMDFVPIMCFQCDDFICSHFCPFNAIIKRSDGIVQINNDKCNGCKMCTYGCPYGVIYYNQDKNMVEKCTLCVSRIDLGLEPSCVQHCIGGALQFVTNKELDEISRDKHKVKIGKVCYLSSKWKLSIPCP